MASVLEVESGEGNSGPQAHDPGAGQELAHRQAESWGLAGLRPPQNTGVPERKLR